MDIFIEDCDIVLNGSKNPIGDKNAQRVFFDLEGSLLYKGDIIQIACITTDWDFHILNVQHEFFRNSYPIQPDEYAIHGISEEFLWENAEFYFSSEITKFPFYPKVPTMYITYSDFDVRKITEEVLKYNLPYVDFGVSVSSLTFVPEKTNHFDAFILGGKKLTKAITPTIHANIEKTFKENKITTVKGLNAHCAVYDTVALLELCKEMMK